MCSLDLRTTLKICAVKNYTVEKLGKHNYDLQAVNFRLF